MTKADNYLVNDIHNILDNGYKDVNPRPRYEDGTPAYTISVNHVVRKYDLMRGEFPVCTLRRQAWKTGIREIFTIYQHPTNVLSEMRDLGVTWWDPWDIGDGTIGQRYGATVKRYDLIHILIDDIILVPEFLQQLCAGFIPDICFVKEFLFCIFVVRDPQCFAERFKRVSLVLFVTHNPYTQFRTVAAQTVNLDTTEEFAVFWQD